MASNIWDAISETKRIINTQPRHYLTLYLIFFLPLTFFSGFFRYLLKNFQQQPLQPSLTVIISLYLFLIIFSTIFNHGAILCITYSVFHGFFNRPVKFKQAIKSISTSFFPLLATNMVIFTGTFFVCFFIVLVTFLIIYLGLVEVYPNLVLMFYFVLMLPVFLIVMHLAVNLSFVHVIVVVESCWGFEPLRRSWKLMKGMKKLVLSTYFLFGSFQILVSRSGYNNWVLIFVASPILAMFSLYNFAVITVLYIYSKEKHGEVANEEFEKEKDGAHLPLIP